MDIIPAALEAYASDHSSAEPIHLRRVREATLEFSARHEMMVGHLEGRLLAMLVALTGARRVLEIGTFTGYSAISMAEALPVGGSIVTCELEERHADFAQRMIDESPYAERITIRRGPALDTIHGLTGAFDGVFIDADKTGYLAYYEAVLPLLAPGGFICVDNVLWSGRVADPAEDDPDTMALRAFNDHLAHDERVEAVMLTVRDGLTIVRRRDGPGESTTNT